VERRALIRLGVAASAVALLGAASWWTLVRFPPDTTPEGAYLRVASNVGRGDIRSCFAYLEERAQHAAYTLRDYRRRAATRIAESYPEPERTRLLDAYRTHAAAADGADVWADLAAHRGWMARLRRDLSGIGKIEVNGERATIETVRGTRYPFRRREGGIWGMTMFTAELDAEAERAARDWDVVQQAADDYDRAR
jgi:hypothetical protein